MTIAGSRPLGGKFAKLQLDQSTLDGHISQLAKLLKQTMQVAFFRVWSVSRRVGVDVYPVQHDSLQDLGGELAIRE